MTLSLFAVLLERLREAAAEAAPEGEMEATAPCQFTPRPAGSASVPGGTGRDRDARGHRLAYVDAAVARLLGEAAGVPIRGVVVSAGTARFVGELTGAVTELDRLGAALSVAPATLADSVVPAGPAALDAAWRVLMRTAAGNAGLREAHLEAIRRRRDAAR